MNIPTGGGLPVGPIGSSKSVIDQQDELKHWPDAKLIEEMQNPTGIAPQYLLFTEVSRREDVRRRYEGAQDQSGMSMAEELIQSKTQPIQPPQQQMPPDQMQGIGAMPPDGMPPGFPAGPQGPMPPAPMPPMPPMTNTPPMQAPSPMPGPGPQRFAYGGLVKGYHQGGPVMPNHNELYPEPHSHPDSVGIDSGDKLVDPKRGFFESFHYGGFPEAWRENIKPVIRDIGEAYFEGSRARAEAEAIPGVYLGGGTQAVKKWIEPRSTSDSKEPFSYRGPSSLISKLSATQRPEGYPDTFNRRTQIQMGIPEYPLNPDPYASERDRVAKKAAEAKAHAAAVAQRSAVPVPSPYDKLREEFGQTSGTENKDIQALRDQMDKIFAPDPMDKTSMLLTAASHFLGAPSVWEGGSKAAGAIAPILMEQNRTNREIGRSRFLAESTLVDMQSKRDESAAGRRTKIGLSEIESQFRLRETRETLKSKSDNLGRQLKVSIANEESSTRRAVMENYFEHWEVLNDRVSDLTATGVPEDDPKIQKLNSDIASLGKMFVSYRNALGGGTELPGQQ